MLLEWCPLDPRTDQARHRREAVGPLLVLRPVQSCKAGHQTLNLPGLTPDGGEDLLDSLARVLLGVRVMVRVRAAGLGVGEDLAVDVREHSSRIGATAVYSQDHPGRHGTVPLWPSMAP